MKRPIGTLKWAEAHRAMKNAEQGGRQGSRNFLRSMLDTINEHNYILAGLNTPFRSRAS
jgi:hypothetical protein